MGKISHSIIESFHNSIDLKILSSFLLSAFVYLIISNFIKQKQYIEFIGLFGCVILGWVIMNFQVAINKIDPQYLVVGTCIDVENFPMEINKKKIIEALLETELKNYTNIIYVNNHSHYIIVEYIWDDYLIMSNDRIIKTLSSMDEYKITFEKCSLALAKMILLDRNKSQ
jgi:hypothetical protein